MTLVFYRKPNSLMVLMTGTGKPTTQLQGKLVAREGDVLLTEKGIKIDGRLVKDFTLFTGDPMPRLTIERIPLSVIRDWKRTRDKLPATFIDMDNNVVEGPTGRIIFNAYQ